MKKLVILVILLAIAAGAGGYWWKQQQDAARDPTLTLYGNVDIRQISLAFNGSGRIQSVRAEEGEAVSTGDVLAVLDTDLLSLQARQAQAQIDAQQQQVRLLRNGPRPEEIAQAKSRLAAAQAAEDRAKLDLTRLRELARASQGQNVTAHDLDAARLSLTSAEASTEAQRQALALLQKGSRPENIAAAESQLQAAQAQLAQLNYQIAQGRLTAPVDAVVRSRLHEPGDMASPQSPVFTLALLHPKWVRLYVREGDLGRVDVGQGARIFTDSQPNRPVEGHVSYIASVAEFTPKSVQTESLRTSLVYEVRVTTDDPANQLRLGQPVTVKLDTDTPR